MYLYNLFVKVYSFKDVTFIISFLISNILSVISHDFKYPIGYILIRYVVIVSWLVNKRLNEITDKIFINKKLMTKVKPSKP